MFSAVVYAHYFVDTTLFGGVVPATPPEGPVVHEGEANVDFYAADLTVGIASTVGAPTLSPSGLLLGGALLVLVGARRLRHRC